MTRRAVLSTLLLLVVGGCAHPSKARRSTRAPEAFVLPLSAEATDRFCVESFAPTPLCVSVAEIRQFVRYFKWADAQPAGSLSSGGAGH